MNSQQEPTSQVVSIVSAALGVTGVGLIFFFSRLIWKVLSSPGDDNPIALLFVFAAGLALVPAWGLILYYQGGRFSWPGWLWLVGAGVIVVLLVPFALMFMLN